MVKDAVLWSALTLQKKEGPAHFGSALLPKKGVAKSVRAFDILHER